MNVIAILTVALFAAPVLWLISHLDRTRPAGGRRAVLGRILLGFAGEVGDLALITATARDELKAAEKDLLKQADAIAEAAEKSESGDFDPAQRKQVRELLDQAKAKHKEWLDAKSDADLFEAVAASDASLASGAGIRSTSKGSLGERFVKDGEIEAYLKRLTGGGKGHVSNDARVQSETVHFGGVKDILSSGTSGDVGGPASSLVGPDFRGLLDVGTWARPLVIRDLVSSGTTESDQVSYARMLAVVNNAEPVAEASGTSAGDASGDVTGAKPESSFELEPVVESVKNIAHWIPMTKRALSDAAQIRTLIDTFLRYGLEEELEDQMVNGDGTGENFEGILNVDGTQDQAFTTDIIVTLRKAKTKAQTIGRGRNLAFVVSPEDDEKIDLMKDNEDRYLGNGPFGNGQNETVWGMRRVVTEAVDTGTAIVGDWRWAMLWDREQAGVALSDSHADFFTRNLVAARAELRAAFGVIRPAAFVITLTA